MVKTQPRQDMSDAVARGHEHDRVNLKFIATAAGILVAIAVVLHVVLWWFWADFSRSARDHSTAPSAVEARRPTGNVVAMDAAPLQGSPGHANLPYEDVIEMNRLNAEHLNSAGTRPDGTRFIPIERAMRLTIERGLLKSATTRPAQPTGDRP